MQTLFGDKTGHNGKKNLQHYRGFPRHQKGIKVNLELVSHIREGYESRLELVFRDYSVREDTPNMSKGNFSSSST